VVQGAQATRERLLNDFRSGAYDVLHYAGHAFFDPLQPSNSGILCSGRKVLTGKQVSELKSVPPLVFFNACESGRVRRAAIAGGKRPAKPKPDTQKLQATVSFAEAFLRGGVAQFIGTYWPVGDDSAKAFAGTFYRQLLDGVAIGTALDASRAKLRDAHQVDWADYIHYGARGFRLKLKG
jgi:CHAT domain-containing protein